jgi:hypothetical protein
MHIVGRLSEEVKLIDKAIKKFKREAHNRGLDKGPRIVIGKSLLRR